MARHGSALELENAASARATQALDEALGLAVRARRGALNLTQQELADRCGISFQQIQKYENGSNRVSFSRLAQIAEALDTSVADFALALQPSAARAPVLSELQLLAAPDGIELIAELNELAPETRRLLLVWLRQVRKDAASRG